MAEQWKPTHILSELYEVSDLGKVRSKGKLVERRLNGSFFRHGRVLKPTLSRGYPYVVLSDRGEQRRVSVATLVCTAFNGPRPDGMQVAHGDGVRDNNKASNLRWATPAENAHDKVRHGTACAGERHHQAKMTERDAATIKARLKRGDSQWTIARSMGIGRGSVCSIALDKTWKNVQPSPL